MNYSNMIEEKNLKKTFIMATLASTLIGTFSASMGLWDRVQDKREQHKQKKIDSKQDDEIKELKKEIQEVKNNGGNRDRDDRDRGDGYRGDGYRGDGYRGGRYIDGPRDEVGYALERDSRMVQRTYDDMYSRMGNRFAQGDVIAENQMQAQIITLQQAVINVLQDALYNDRQLTRNDMAKIVAASNSAREGSLDALRQAQQRLGPASTSSRSPSPPRNLEPVKRASTNISDGSNQLFCRYSLDLQYIQNKPLAASFAPGGNCECPACGVRLDVTAEDFWMIGKRTPITVVEKGYERDYTEVREFRLGQRFALKCHTPNGEYACTICNRNRDVDAICRTVDALVKHVGTFHDLDELDREVDLREMPVDPRRMSLPAPPAPPVMSRREEIEISNYR